MNTIISSVLILVAIGLLFALTQLRSSKWTDYSENKADLQLMELTAFTQSRLNDTVAVSDEVLSKGTVLIAQIEELKKGLILHINNGEPAELSDLLRDLGKEINQTNSFFFSDNGQAKQDLQKLREGVNGLYFMIPKEMKSKANMLNTEKRFRYGESREEIITWEEDMFSHVTFSNALRKLNQLELAITLCGQ